MQIYLITLFGAIFVYLLIIIILSTSGKEKEKNRLARYFKENNANDVQEQFIREKNEEEQKKKKHKFRIVNKEFSNYIASSGLKLTAVEFIYFWLSLTIIPMIIIVFMANNIITTVAIGIIGFAIPPIIVIRSRKKRDELFNKQLGEALIIIGNSLKGGFTFLQGMESIAIDMQPPISKEFSKVLTEIHYGVKQMDALNHMVERTKNKDLELLVSAVLISSQVGSNLSEILDTIAATIRDRIRIKQEIRTFSAQGRVSGIIIGFLPIAIILTIMVINPEYFDGFFESDIGKIMIAVSVILEIIGFTIINKIVNIKV